MNSATSAVTTVAPTALKSGNMSRGRFRRAYWVDTKYEFLRMIRNPIVSVPLLALPVAMYVLICIFLVHTIQLPVGLDIKTAQTAAFANWMVFGLMGPAMMSFGVGVAAERESGLMTFKRALPMPPFAFLLSKLLGAVLFACVVLACMTLVTVLLSEVELSAWQYLKLFGAGMLMVLPFCTLGLVVGVSVPVAGAMALANLGWIGLAMLGGLMFPIPRSIAMWTPTYYAGQLSQGIVGLPTQAAVWISVSVLCVLAVILGALAVNRINVANDDR